MIGKTDGSSRGAGKVSTLFLSFFMQSSRKAQVEARGVPRAILGACRKRPNVIRWASLASLRGFVLLSHPRGGLSLRFSNLIILRRVAVKVAIVAVHPVANFVVPAFALRRIVGLEHAEAHAGILRVSWATRSSRGQLRHLSHGGSDATIDSA